MADLDDFFAKKDRRRNKGVAKPDESKKETRERPRPREGEEPRSVEEEEWKEYEETVKDYTGLKIQVLQGSTGPTGPDSTSGDENVAGQETNKTKGPWNKPEQPEAPEPAPEPEKPKPQPPPPAKTGAYKPPSARREVPEQQVAPRRQQNRHAPDIHNADFFPVLGASGKPRGGGGWNTATGATANRQTAQRRPLALDNRFTSLQDDS